MNGSKYQEHLVLLLLIVACGEGDLCGDFVEMDGRCVCPGDLVVSDDGSTCVEPRGGIDASVDASPQDSGRDSCVSMVEMCNDIDDDCDGTTDEDAAESCNLPNAVAACIDMGSCVIDSCEPGFLDCSDDPGCETPRSRDACGSCDADCAPTRTCTELGCQDIRLEWAWTFARESRDYSRPPLVAAARSQVYFAMDRSNSAAVVSNPIVIEGPGASITEGDLEGGGVALLLAASSDGSLHWRAAFRSEEDITVANIAALPTLDAVYVAGTFSGEMVVTPPTGEPLVLRAPGEDRDGFLVRFDSLGAIYRMSQFSDSDVSSPTTQTVSSMAVASDGFVFVSGTTSGPMSERPGGVARVTDSGPFVIRVNSIGTATGAVSAPPAVSMDTDEVGNVYCVTQLSDTPVQISGEEFVSDRFFPLIWSMSPDLVSRWAEAPGAEAPSGSSGEEHRPAISYSGGVVSIVAGMSGEHLFGDVELSAGAFVADFDAGSGALEETRYLGGANGTVLGIDRAEGAYTVAMSSVGVLDLGEGEVGPGVAGDVAFGRFSDATGYDFFRVFGGAAADSAWYVKAFGAGWLVSGTWDGTMEVDDRTFDGRGLRRSFVAFFAVE